EVDGLSQLGVGIVEMPRLVTPGLPSADLVRRQTEEEEVFRAHGAANLDVGTVEGADRQRAVQRELHVASARGLLARRGDLFRQVGRGIDALSGGDVEVG